MYKEEPDEEVHAEIVDAIEALEKDLQQYELSMLLNGPHDKNSAILEIHPGAGGTESQDWGSMLLRMYMRWAENMVTVLKQWIIKTEMKQGLSL